MVLYRCDYDVIYASSMTNAYCTVDVIDAVRGTAWYSLATRGLVMGDGVGGGVGSMVSCNGYSNC